MLTNKVSGDIKMAREENIGDLFLENELLSPYAHLMQVKGKRIRLKIILAFNYWLQVHNEKLNYIVDAVTMVNGGSLLIDDIQDNTQVRLGQPAAHCVFGVPLTINAAVHTVLLVSEKMFKLDPRAAEIMTTELLEITRGQGIDIYWRDNNLCPTEEQYQNMVKQKTGGMLMLGVRLLQLFSENKTDYSKLVLLLGTYFQIRDDYCNLMCQEALEGWPGKEEKQECNNDIFCEDITEGKFSLPVIHAMQSSDAEEIMNILRLKTRNQNVKKHCMSLLEKAGSLQYTRDVLAKLDRETRAEVTRLGGNPKMELVLEELITWRT